MYLLVDAMPLIFLLLQDFTDGGKPSTSPMVIDDSRSTTFSASSKKGMSLGTKKAGKEVHYLSLSILLKFLLYFYL